MALCAGTMMKNTENSLGKAQLIFVLEYDRITGGMMHSITSLLAHIKERYDILVISPKGELADELKSGPYTVKELGDIQLWHSKNIFKRVRLLWQLLREIKSCQAQTPVVVTNNIYAQLLVSICSYFVPVKVVYFNRGGDLKNTISRLVIWLSHHLTLVLSTSSNQKRIVDRSGILRHGARTIVLSNPVDMPMIAKNQLPIEGADKSFNIGIVGYIDRGKNQILALEALSLLQKRNLDVVIHLYGEANNPTYLTEIKEKICQLSLEEHVEFKGFTNDKSALYHNIDLLLSTSIAEGFGRTLVEAMLMKKPVVALKIAGGPADIIPSEQFGLLVDDNAKSVADAIEKFICNLDFRHVVIENAYARAVDKFKPESIADQFVLIMESEVL